MRALYNRISQIIFRCRKKAAFYIEIQLFFHSVSSNIMKGVDQVLYGSDADSREEIARLMEKYGSSLLRMSALYLKDAFLAQDAVQETFLKAYRHAGDFRSESSEKTWLTSICINTCRDMLKSAYFRHNSRIDMDLLSEKPAEFCFPDNTVISEVMSLPPKYREVVLLRYYEQMKIKEVASALKLSVGKTRTRLNKANEILRGRLKEWYEDEES